MSTTCLRCVVYVWQHCQNNAHRAANHVDHLVPAVGKNALQHKPSMGFTKKQMCQTHSAISPWTTSTQQHARHACCDHNVHVHAMLHTLQVHVLMLGGGHPCSSPGATCTQHRLLNELCTQGFAGWVLAKHQSILMLHNARSNMHQQPCPPSTYITNHISMCQPLPPRLLTTGAHTYTCIGVL